MREDDFEWEVQNLVIRLGLDNLYGTPAYVLARFLREILQSWAWGLKTREEWYGRALNPPLNDSRQAGEQR